MSTVAKAAFVLANRSRALGYVTANRRRVERTTVWESFESATGWTTSNSSVAADTTNVRTGTQSLKVTATSTTGTAGYAEKTVGLPQIGKYVRIGVHIPDVEKVARIGFLWFTGPTSGGNYYSYSFQAANNELVEGWQTFDFHVDRRSPGGGTPDPSELVSLIRVYVYPVSGDTADATFDLWENCSRRPAVVFMNDDAYLEFTNDVLPLLDQRGLACNIQLQKATIDAWASAPSTRPEGKASLAELLPYVRRGTLHFGLHVNCQQETDAEFKGDFLDQYRAANDLGLLPDHVVVSALQGIYSTQARLDWLAATGAILRRGDIFQSANLDGFMLNPPDSGALFTDLITKELEHTVDDVDVTGWLDSVLDDETVLSLFGHGTDSLNPGQQFRTPLSVYEAFFDHYDSVKARIDWFSPADFAREFGDARSSMKSRLTSWSY